ncbi:MAG: polyprenol phosphomannose-dependent alpha 1,6 mannosyltransferase MptB [Mycobacteriales bacterium]
MTRGAARRVAVAGVAGLAVSAALTAAVAALGPSAMEPGLGGPGGRPPYSLVAHPAPGLVVALAAVAVVSGAVALALALLAARRGALPPARWLLAGGLAAAAVLAALPPFGSADHLNYAAYGRMVTTGHDPYATGAATLAAEGDPVGRQVREWRHSPSVYGPVATGAQAVASWLGGASARRTVWWLSVLNLLAFAAVALLLHAMARGDPAAQARAALLWAANPLVLYELVAGAHVDTLGIALAAGALAVRHRSPLAAGALAGAALSVKLPAAVVGAGLLAGYATARARRAAATALAGMALVTGAGYLLAGPHVLAQTRKASGFVSIATPWRRVRPAVESVVGAAHAGRVIGAASLLVGAVLAVLLLRALPPASRERRVALALTLAWLFAATYALPWYDGLAWMLLALVPASRFDGLLLARTAVLALGYLPARQVRLPGLEWLVTVVRSELLPPALALLTAGLVIACLRRPPSRAS